MCTVCLSIISTSMDIHKHEWCPHHSTIMRISFPYLWEATFVTIQSLTLNEAIQPCFPLRSSVYITNDYRFYHIRSCGALSVPKDGDCKIGEINCTLKVSTAFQAGWRHESMPLYSG